MRDWFELNRANISAPSYFPAAYLITPGQGSEEAISQMFDNLISQGIEIHRLEREIHFLKDPNKYPMMLTQNDIAEFPAGSHIIFTAQPYNSLVRALFEPRKIGEIQNENSVNESAVHKDIFAWTLPMIMGIETIPVPFILEPKAYQRVKLIEDINDVDYFLGLSNRKQLLAFANPLRHTPRIAVYESRDKTNETDWLYMVFRTFNIPFLLYAMLILVMET